MNKIQMTFSLINLMIGETALVLPVLFNQEGYISCILVLILQGFISYKTCGILVANLKPKENDVSDTIQRILGIKWWKFFQILSCIYLYLVSLQYFLLCNNMIYRMITFLMLISGNDNFAAPSHFSYSQFSLQYLGYISAIPIGFLTFIRKMDILVKISEYGIYSIFSFVIFIFTVFISNVASGRLGRSSSQVNLWSFDIGNVSGASAIGYSVHTTIGPVIKQHKNQDENYKILGFAYFSVFLIYLSIGLFGGLGILGRDLRAEFGENINDYFSQTDVSIFIVQILYFVNLITCLPMSLFISRQRLFQFFYSEREPPQQLFVGFNLFYVFLCILLQNIPSIKSEDLMNVNGAITCFFTMYLIPIILHFQAYHGQDSLMLRLKKSISKLGVIDDSEIALESTLLSGVKSQKEDKYNLFINDDEDSDEDLNEDVPSSKQNQQNPKQMKQTLKDKKEFEEQKKKLIENQSKNFSIIFYGIIGLIGLISLIYGIFALSKKFFSSNPDSILDDD
ncbi:hypothetical protein ABPG73_005535 [Tetrahymena malaccensis]